MSKQRVGIYAGTFDPVHVGHIAFALQAMEAARLDRLYFLPERVPRHKHSVTHYAHRVAMLRRAIKPHAKFDLLDLPERHFTVLKTVPAIRRTIGGEATIVLLVGSDVAAYLPKWDNVDALAKQVELCVGLRSGADERAIRQELLPLFSSKQLHIVRAFAADVSSSQVRSAIRTSRWAFGLFRSVYGYAKQEWLYV